MSLAADSSTAPSSTDAADAARQDAFVRAELIRRLFEGSKQSRYFSFVLWPVIAAIYWRQIDLTELVPPFVAHLAVTIGFDILRRNFTHANPPDEEVVRWGWWFAGLSFLAGACWGVVVVRRSGVRMPGSGASNASRSASLPETALSRYTVRRSNSAPSFVMK